MLLQRTYEHGGAANSKTMLDFSVNVNPYGTPEGVVLAIEKCLKDLADYPDAYCDKLRNAIGKHYGIDKRFIICGNGASELIDHFVLSVDGDRRAMVVCPSFLEYERSINAHKLQLFEYVLDEKDGFAITDEVLDALEENVGSIFLCTPSNPVGNEVKADMLERILKKCEELKIRCLLDVSFLDLTRNPNWELMTDLVKKYKELFLVSAFTKSHGLAGVRLGFGFCTDEAFLEKMSSMGGCWNVSVMAQAAGIEAVNCDDYLVKTRVLIENEHIFLISGLQALGFKVYEGAANYIFFKGSEGLKPLLENKGICIRDCSNYTGLGDGYYRICIKCHKDNEKLILALKDVTGRSEMGRLV